MEVAAEVHAVVEVEVLGGDEEVVAGADVLADGGVVREGEAIAVGD